MNDLPNVESVPAASDKELRRALRELAPLQQRYVDLYDEAPCGYVTCDARRHITGVNQTFAKLLRQSPEDLIDHSLDRLLHRSATDRNAFHHHWETLCSQATTAQCEVHLYVLNGPPPIVHLDSRSYFDPEGRLFEVRITVTDMSAQRQAEEKIRQREAMYRHVVELTPNPLFAIARDGSFRDCNTATAVLLGKARDEILRSNIRDFFRLSNHGAENDVIAALWTGQDTAELECTHAGKTRTVHAAITRLRQEHEPHVFVIGTEVTDHKRTESSLRHDVLHDRLTGLPNRQLFIEEVDRALKRMRRENHYRFGLLFIDIDNFKKINDGLGHLIGDELLREVGNRLTGAVREVDVLARFAGDEFTILIKDASERADVDAAAQRVLRIMNDPIVLGGAEVRVKVSIGGTVSRAEHTTADAIIREADDAMYTVKHRGRNGYVAFGVPKQRLAQQEMRAAAADLRRAIEDHRLVLHYQPIVAIASDNKLLGLEALIRWPREEGGYLLPSEFLFLVHEFGLCEVVTRWVVHEACQQISQWSSQRLFDNDWYVSVNICPPLLNCVDLAVMVGECLAATGIDPHRLAVDIPVSALFEACKSVDENMQAFHRMGLRVEVDGFGTEYAEMIELCNFPVHGVKIDRAFVRLLDGHPKDRRTLRGLVALAQGLGFHVTAVGVETASQWEYLRASGCDAAQGFLFSDPLPKDRIETRIKTL